VATHPTTDESESTADWRLRASMVHVSDAHVSGRGCARAPRSS
jgi:hypothetical protein